MHICWSRVLLEIFIITCSLFWIAPEVELSCAGMESPFDILPEGDHIIEYGSVLELFCKLNASQPNESDYTAKDLQFFFYKGTNKILPNTTVLNDTTIKMNVSPSLGSTYYFCSLNETKTCLTNVKVGYKPQPVLNFQCTSYNWERLYCHWTPPENPIKTEYIITFRMSKDSGRNALPCPNQQDLANNSCMYDFDTDPPYRQWPKYYFFEITGRNALGVFTENHTLHHYAYVIPNKPENVKVINKTVGSAVIGWDIPHPVNNFPPGLRFKIEFRNKWEDWTEVNNTYNKKISGDSYTYNITGLNYSHTVYEARVYLKSFDAKIGPEYWSQSASVKFTTPLTVPSKAPSTTQGSFEVVSSGNGTDVFIYWARLSEKFENGLDFTYGVKCTSDDGSDCGFPIEKSGSYAKFPISGLHSYTFSIYSVNELGRSEESSYVFVPKFNTFIQPESFTKVAYDHGVFELSWKPVVHKDLSNYTIFWCKEDKDLPVPCKGYLDWITVPKDATSKNITMGDVTKFYKFAIAANLIDGASSGMVWSACVIYHNKVLKRVDDFHISRVEAREVDVVWEIRCAQSSVFKGFAFYYCPVDVSSHDDSCLGNSTEEVTKLNESQERNITLTNLRPYTTYKLQISIISLDGSQQIQLGPRSVSKRFYTLEDAPSVPLNLTASSITNHSVLLSWILPEESNGLLQTYKLSFDYPGGEKHVKFDAQSASDNSIVNKYQIQGLVSYTTYNFTLKVCTSTMKCSNYSEPIAVTTLIGSPNKMSRPQVSIVNSTVADVSWELPVPAAGPINFYQLLITVDGESTDTELIDVTGSRVKIPVKACEVKYNTPEFRIRAINIDENNTSYYGPWSEATQVHCGSSAWSEKTVLIDWISGTCTLLVVSICVFYIVKKGWLQCKKMKDVEVKLPPGLQSQDLEKDNQDYVHLERWPPRSPETVGGSGCTVLAPDEESLLDKKSDESMDITSFNMPIKNGGDSSGCSVGRESVSSSITSDTHVSFDSGAEPDQCVMKSSTLEPWNSSDKRNSNNDRMKTPSPKRVINFTDLGDWDLNESVIPGYTKVGFTSCFVPEKNLPSKGYVTIANVTSLTTPQKTNNECNGNALTARSFVTPSEDPFPLNSGLNNINNNNSNSSSTPRYVSLAQFEGQKMGVSSVPTNMRNGESSPKESPKLSRLDESLEQDDEKTEDSVEDFSGTETETDTIHEVPITGNSSTMPPYVSMVENPTGNVVIDVEEEEEEEEEEETNEENVRLSCDLNDLDDKKAMSGMDSALPDKMNKDNNSFPNYIPHHLFGKESVQT